MCQGIKEMFYEGNMTQMGEGISHMSVQFIGPNVQLSNRKATPLLQEKSPGSFCFAVFYFIFLDYSQGCN